MIIIRKSQLRRGLVVGLVAALLVGVTVSLTFAQSEGGVTITTPPIKSQEVFIDFNGNGAFDADESLGVFPFYDGNQPLEFSWLPYAFPAGSEGSYKIALWQITGITSDFEFTYTVSKVSHHWASNPNGTSFVMGSFGFGEAICSGCLSFITVEAEIVVKYLDPTTGSYEYEYISLVGAYTANQEDGSGFEYTDPFAIEIVRPEPEEKEKGGGDACVPSGQFESNCADGLDDDCDGDIDNADSDCN
jgi:hypothetical protein